MHPIEQEELMAYLDGELPSDRAATAAAHLERCHECQGLAADVQGVSRFLMAWQIESADPRTPRGIADALAQRAARRTWQDVLRVRRASPWVWGLAGAVVVVALLNSLNLGTRRQAVQVNLVKTKNPAMIVRAAQLTLTAKDFDKARGSLEDILKQHRGYFGQLNISAPAGAGRILEATLRVPGDQLDAVMTELKRLGRVESESQSGEEVTQQYVDLEARLSNARNAEQRLTDLLRQRAGKLADVLAVELEIDHMRGEIERMEAERKSLAHRVDFATLNVKLAEDYRAQLQVAPDSTLARFRNAAVEGYRSMVEGVVSLILFLLSYGPTLLLWAAILFFPVRMAWRRLRRDL